MGHFDTGTTTTTTDQGLLLRGSVYPWQNQFKLKCLSCENAKELYRYQKVIFTNGTRSLVRLQVITFGCPLERQLGDETTRRRIRSLSPSSFLAFAVAEDHRKAKVGFAVRAQVVDTILVNPLCPNLNSFF